MVGVGVVGVGVVVSVVLSLLVMMVGVVEGNETLGEPTTTTAAVAAPPTAVAAAAAAVTPVLLISSFPSLQPRPVYYRFASPAFGNFTLVWDWQTVSSYKTLTVDKLCTCRNACWSSPMCVAASVTKGPSGDGRGGSKFSCHLSPNSPVVGLHINSADSAYLFWEASLPSPLHLGVQEDGLEYLVVRVDMNYKEAQGNCSNIPGYRLAVTKSVQSYGLVQSLVKYLGTFLVLDLYREKDVKVWGDGTEYLSSPVAVDAVLMEDMGTNRAYVADGFRFVDFPEGESNNPPLCQANPNNIIW